MPEVFDFEDNTVGALPVGWQIVEPAKDVVFSTVEGPSGHALQLTVTGEGGGKLRRELDVARYRGKRVLVSARGRCTPGLWWARARVGIDVTRSARRSYEDRGGTDRIVAPEWRSYEAIVDVADDATGLAVEVHGAGASTVQIDDISLTIVGAVHAGDEPPRALTDRGAANVVAFARLYGIVRYFHPSDEAAALDGAAWEHFVVRGVRHVEGASNAAELKARLDELFAPLAPTLVTYLDEEPAPALEPAPANAIHWIHTGIGISPNGVYRSVRGEPGAAPTYVTITTPINVERFRGKSFEVTLRAKAKVDATTDVGLWIAESRAGGGKGFYTEPEMQPAVAEDQTWSTIQVQGKIADDATKLTFGVQVIGNGASAFELPILKIGSERVDIPGWEAKRGGRTLATAWEHSRTDFDVWVARTGCERKASCLNVSRRPTPPPDLRPWQGSLGGGVSASVQIALATQEGKTVPAAGIALPAADATPLTPSDRATRLAAVIIAWNVFEHFYPYFDVRGTDWMPELPRALRTAAEDAGAEELHRTLRRLVYALHDGHGNVSHPGEDLSTIAPWSWEKVEGRLVITGVSPLCSCELAPGDVVTAIDGTQVERAIADASALISAATERHRESNALYLLRIGPERGHKAITVARGGTERTIEVALIEPVANEEALRERRPVSGSEVAPGIRYVDLDSVTAEEWAKVLPDLAAADGVVLDMRGYPNISLQTPLAHATRKRLQSARWHVPQPTRPDREGMTFNHSDWNIDPASPFLDNVVFLTDGRAVSAAETFMGIVEHYKLGEIVGGPTAGTNGNVNPFMVPGGYRFWWTGMKVLKHDGSRHHGVGIQPTVPATRTIAGVAAGRDEILEKGIEVAQKGAKKRKRARR